MSERSFKVALVCVAVLGIVLLISIFAFTTSDNQQTVEIPTIKEVDSNSKKTAQVGRQSLSHAELSKKIENDSTNRFKDLTNPEIAWQLRVKQLQRMDASSLTAVEKQTLLDALEYRPTHENAEYWWVVVNEVMKQLRLKRVVTDQYSDLLLAIANDADRSPVVRDYAVQHLGMWVAPDNEAIQLPYENDPKKVEDVIETIASLTSSNELQHTSVPGSSLMVLVSLYENGANDDLIEKAFMSLNGYLYPVITGNTPSDLITRTSAINAIGMAKRTEFRSVIRDLINDDSVNDSVRLSSIAALGFMAEDADLSLFRSIISSDNKFKYAAKAALARNSQ